MIPQREKIELTNKQTDQLINLFAYVDKYYTEYNKKGMLIGQPKLTDMGAEIEIGFVSEEIGKEFNKILQAAHGLDLMSKK